MSLCLICCWSVISFVCLCLSLCRYYLNIFFLFNCPGTWNIRLCLFFYFSLNVFQYFFISLLFFLSFIFSLCFSISLSLYLSQVYLWSLVSVLNIQTGSQTMTFNFYHQQLKYTNNLFVIVLIWVEQICQLIQFCSLIQIWAYFRINTLSTYISIFMRIHKYEYVDIFYIFA